MSKISKNPRTAALVGGATLLAGVLLVGGEVAAASKRVHQICRSDYKRFCPGYTEGSSELRQCMRANGGAISKRCVDALVDSGDVSRAEVERYRGRR